MATETLIVELDARTARLDASLRSTNARLDELSENADNTQGSLRRMASGAGAAFKVVAKGAAAFAALSGLITAATLTSAKNRKESELLAAQAKTTVQDFQALTFATAKYNISAEQMGDISKEIALKISEFGAAGTGAFQDYADVMSMTKDQAKAAAQEFEGMSSQEVLGKMVSRMEDAGVSAGDMNFAIDALASDAERIVPLFANNSKELTELKNRFNDVNDSIKITGTQAAALKDVSETFTLLQSSAGKATTAITATLAPVLDDFFNDIIKVVPDATQTIVDFINSFLDAENISSISGVNKEIVKSMEAIEYQESRIATQKGHALRVAKGLNEEEKKRLSELEAQLEVLTEQEKKIEDARRLGGGQIGGETGAGISSITDGSGTGDEKQAILDRFKEEETLLAEKLVREIEIIGSNHEAVIDLEKQFVEDIEEIRREAREKESELNEEEIAKKAKLEEKAGKAKISLEKDISDNAVSLIKRIGGENKAAALAALVIQKASALSANATATLSGSMLAYASQLIPGDPTSVIRAEAAKQYTLGLGALNAGLIVATGLGEAAGIASGGGGGGGVSGGGGGTQTQPQQQNFEAETTSLELSSATDAGASSSTIRFATDSGDELMDTIAGLLNKGAQEGRY
jgi:hypothetical protein